MELSEHKAKLWHEEAQRLYVELVATQAELNYHKEVKETFGNMLDERADEIYNLKVSLDAEQKALKSALELTANANNKVKKLQDRIDGYEDMLADGTPYKMTYRPVTDVELESGNIKPGDIVREGNTLYINQSGKDLAYPADSEDSISQGDRNGYDITEFGIRPKPDVLPTMHPSRKKVNVYSPDPE